MNLVEKLLALDKNKVAEKKTGTYESKRLKALVGDGTVKIMEIEPERMSELGAMLIDKKGDMDASKSYAMSLYITVEGVTSPDLRNGELKKHFGAETAAELAKILFRSEVLDIAEAIQKLDEEESLSEKEIKN